MESLDQIVDKMEAPIVFAIRSIILSLRKKRMSANRKLAF